MQQERETAEKRGAPSARDERIWSALSHLTIFLNFPTGFIGGPVASFVIWLVYRGRSPRIAFHALQSTWYQIPWLVFLWASWTVLWTLLVPILIGFLLMPVLLVVSAIPFVHSAYAAYRISEGQDFEYPVVADFVSRSREPRS